MPKKPKRALKIVLIVLASIALILIAASTCAILWYQNSLSAFYEDGCATEECKAQDFVVAQGDGATQIADKLEKAGIIKSSLAFRIYVKFQAPNKKLLPGTYQFSKKMSVERIVQSLNTGVVAKTVRIMFLPGETIRASRKHLIDAGYPEAEVDEALNKHYDHELLKSKPDDASLEGYIWGDTYEFYADASVEIVLTKIFDHMLKAIKDADLISKFEARGFTLHQAITLASVIQREAPASYEEKRHIAQVFLTRLDRGIVLGSDAIIAYAADQINPDRDKSDMSYLNTIQCPWNSRRCGGLPPTPIATPNLDSLKAVADPTNTDDIYFLTGDDGNMYYAKTEAGHNDNIRNYCKKMCQIL